jgi:hypothetical protein
MVKLQTQWLKCKFRNSLALPGFADPDLGRITAQRVASPHSLGCSRNSELGHVSQD